MDQNAPTTITLYKARTLAGFHYVSSFTAEYLGWAYEYRGIDSQGRFSDAAWYRTKPIK